MHTNAIGTVWHTVVVSMRKSNHKKELREHWIFAVANCNAMQMIQQPPQLKVEPQIYNILWWSACTILSLVSLVWTVLSGRDHNNTVCTVYTANTIVFAYKWLDKLDHGRRNILMFSQARSFTFTHHLSNIHPPNSHEGKECWSESQKKQSGQKIQI